MERFKWINPRKDPELQKFINEHKTSCHTIGDLVDKYLETKGRLKQRN